MKLSPRRRRRTLVAFTLVELLVVIGIIALLLAVSFPAFSSMIAKGQSIACSEKLKSIGVAVIQAASDNNNTYPEIDQAATPVYSPPGQGIVAVLGPYGISTNTIQCPVDMNRGAQSSFTLYGSSYEWNPILDDGSVTGTVVTVPVYTTPTSSFPMHSARVRLCTDFLGIHNNKQNALYGDGHVVPR